MVLSLLTNGMQKKYVASKDDVLSSKECELLISYYEKQERIIPWDSDTPGKALSLIHI